MLTQELARQGDWLFRHRSYVPLVLLPFAILVVALHPHRWTDVLWLQRVYELGCLFISLLGVAVRGMSLGWAQAGSSGRNTKEQIAENLNTFGMYSVCRHPLYLGNILMMLGIALFTRSLLFSTVGLLFYVLVYERIIAAEERFLEGKFGDTFRTWAETTPALIPQWVLWKKPPSSFSFRAAIKGEFYGVTALFITMLLFRTADTFFSERIFRLDMFWLAPSAVMLVMFFILRYLRKHTRFFEKTHRIA
jgi:protein-S-isoprenylcysteine O-methyltransferase Ste14